MGKSESLRDPSPARVVAEQIQVELTILVGIEDTLRAALRWRTQEQGNSRKLATLRHHLSSFDRQLIRTQLLMDETGYLQTVAETAPELGSAINSLRDRRSALQHELTQLLFRLELSSPQDIADLDRMSEQIGQLLDRFESHARDEISLVQRAMNQEHGGSG